MAIPLKVRAVVWTLAVFFFATLADFSFKNYFITLGIAGLVFAFISVLFSVAFIQTALGFSVFD